MSEIPVLFVCLAKRKKYKKTIKLKEIGITDTGIQSRIEPKKIPPKNEENAHLRIIYAQIPNTVCKILIYHI